MQIGPNTTVPMLRTARADRGWSQTFVADALGLSVSTVSRIEAGLMQPNNAQLFLLATLFGKGVAEVASWFDTAANKAA